MKIYGAAPRYFHLGSTWMRVKIKAKLPLNLIHYVPRQEHVLGEWRRSSSILDLGTTWNMEMSSVVNSSDIICPLVKKLGYLSLAF